MSTYVRAYQALAKIMPAKDAARLLAELRKETGRELAAEVREHARREYLPRAADSLAEQRKQRTRFGVAFSAAGLIETTTGNPITTTPKLKRTTRSTS